MGIKGKCMCRCGSDLSKEGSVIRRYYKEGYYGGQGIFIETSSLYNYDDICGTCERIV